MGKEQVSFPTSVLSHLNHDLPIFFGFIPHDPKSLFQILEPESVCHSWYLTLYAQILFSSTNLYLPGPFPLTLCIICAAFIAFMIHQLIELLESYFIPVLGFGNDLTISIPLCFQQHLLELGNINDASGVFFVIKRLRVVIIINN